MEISDKVLKLTEEFSNLDISEQEQFLKLNGMFCFYDNSLEKFTDECIEDETKDETAIWFEDLFTDKVSEKERTTIIEKFFKHIKKEQEANQTMTYFCIPYNSLFKHHILTYQAKIMTVIDNANDNNFLILATRGEENQNINRYKFKQDHKFDFSDTYSPYTTICKSLLPKLLEEFQANLHGHPAFCENEKEWNSILLRLIWFCHESIYLNDEINLYEKPELKQAYLKFYQESKNLFCEHFLDLWD